jgi:hypothetical protein
VTPDKYYNKFETAGRLTPSGLQRFNFGVMIAVSPIFLL